LAHYGNEILVQKLAEKVETLRKELGE
jgi:hypothetical protein